MSETQENVVKESEELFTTQDILDVAEYPDENVAENDEIVPSSEPTENEPMEDDEEVVEDVMDDDIEEKGTAKKKLPADRLTELPLARIKHIIKLDPEVNLVSNEAIFLITKATENFIKSLAKESSSLALQQKKKTVAKSHVDFALTMLPVEL